VFTVWTTRILEISAVPDYKTTRRCEGGKKEEIEKELAILSAQD
jgi:hypothetical protein